MNGKLTVKADSPSVFGTTIKIGDIEFPIVSMNISGDVNEGVWKVEMVIWTQGLDIELPEGYELIATDENGNKLDVLKKGELK